MVMPDKAVSPPAAADPEMSERPKRRTFTAQQKLRILEETDRATGSGEVGAILRREGLYSSSLTDWRRQRAAGTLTALTPAKRGPKAEASHPLAAELAADRRHRRDVVMTAALSAEQRERIDALLGGPGGDTATLDALRTGPVHRRPTELKRHLARLDAIRAVDLAPAKAPVVPAALVQRVARLARASRPSSIAALSEPRRTATVVALFHTLEAVALDDTVELFEALLADWFRQAKQAAQNERLQGLVAFDAAARLLRDTAKQTLIDPDEVASFAEWQEALFAALGREAIASIDTEAGRDDGRVLAHLTPRWRTAHHLFHGVLSRVAFDAVPASTALTEVLECLAGAKSWSAADMSAAPGSALSASWRRLALDDQGKVVDNKAYVFGVLDAWRRSLKTRDLFVPGALRFSDPRRGLLDGERWREAQPTVCRALERSMDGAAEVAVLTERLDQAYRRVAAGFDTNPYARIEQRGERAELAITPLDRLERPDGLIALQSAVHARLPKVDLADILLEVAARTGFAADFTHLSERQARVEDFPLSLCAVLLAEACNIGFEPVSELAVPALRRDRLSWVAQNFVRAETIAAANARLVSAHDALPITRHWGSGDLASADGVRFSAPATLVHAGPNAKYFQTGRGITLYNLVSDQFTGLNALVVPGTLRDSLFILALLLEQETDLAPSEITSDTAAYSDVVFGLFHLLGYQFSPRLADIGQTRLWRAAPTTEGYGALAPLARHRLDTALIEANWPDLMRLAGSLKLGHVPAVGVMRILQARDRPTALGRALAELGRLIKTLHILSLIDDDAKRRRILIQLNRHEFRHRLGRRVCHGERGEIRKPYRQGQEEQLGALGFTLNAIAFWNALYMQAAIRQLEAEGWRIDLADIARLSPLTHRHINFLGRYAFVLPESVAAGKLRPLSQPTSA